jgi:YegS/Rv2252/BmrU family lipid kinase
MAMAKSRRRADEPGVRPEAGDRLLVIANPVTRRSADQLIAALRANAPEGVDLDIQVTTRAGEARDIALARAPGARLIVAIGGDGTVADCAAALMDSRIPLAVMPGGSTNITAREQGVPTGARQAARLIFGANEVRRIDAGLCDDRVFLHMAGAGFDARFFANTSPALKRRFGWMAYIPAAAGALRHRSSRFHIVFDDGELDLMSPLVLIANGPSVIHPRFRIHPAIEDNDGMLDLIAITATRPTELARTIGRLCAMQLANSPFVLHRKVRQVTIESLDEVPIEVDGDVFGTTPRTFRVLPEAIRMLVPAS